jgi:hypothetical protein
MERSKYPNRKERRRPSKVCSMNSRDCIGIFRAPSSDEFKYISTEKTAAFSSTG